MDLKLGLKITELRKKKGMTQEQLAVSSQMRLVFLQGLEKDACFEELRGEERFEKLTAKLKESLEE